MIGDFEYQVLSVIMGLRDDAYGTPIKAGIEKDFKRTVSYGALYTTLSRMEKKGFVTSKLGEATAVRGGRAKKLYAITGLGQSLVREKRKALTPRSGLGGVYA